MYIYLFSLVTHHDIHTLFIIHSYSIRSKDRQYLSPRPSDQLATSNVPYMGNLWRGHTINSFNYILRSDDFKYVYTLLTL